MTEDATAIDVLNSDVSVRDPPAEPKREDVNARHEHFMQELTIVADRYRGPLTATEVCQGLFDFADSYAVVYDIDIEVAVGRDPNGEPVAMVQFPSDDVDLAPIGKWNPSDYGDVSGWPHLETLDEMDYDFRDGGLNE